MYSSESMVLIRPDRYCVWHLMWGGVLTDADCERIFSTACGWLEPSPESEAMSRWLTKKFNEVTEPLINTFPMAVRVVGEDKEAVLQRTKEKKKEDVGLTTKNA